MKQQICQVFTEASAKNWLNFEIAQFLMALTQKVLQDVKKSFDYVHLNTKIHGISPDSRKYSTTVTTLLQMRNILLSIYDFLKDFKLP